MDSSSSVIVLSSGDESEVDKDVVVVSEKTETKQKTENHNLLLKKKRILLTPCASKPEAKGNCDTMTDKRDFSCASPKKQKISTYDKQIPVNLKAEKVEDPVCSKKEINEEIFEEFVDTCLKLDTSGNMKIIIDRKLKKYFSLLIPEYRSSDQFITFLERKGMEMKRSPSQLFVHLKEVVDEMNIHRSDKQNKLIGSKTSDRFVQKMCKTMEVCLKRIKKLEEKEVDWDDENDSTYIQLQKYRARLVQIHKKLQEIQGMSTQLNRKIVFSGSQFPRVNKAIEKYVNVKGEFPDYHDVCDILKDTYEREDIPFTKEMLRCEAKKVFLDIGEQLQKNRKIECWESVSYFLKEQQDDPADGDEILHTVLEENKKKFQSQIDEIINTFAEKPLRSQFASEDSNSSESIVKKEVNEDRGEKEKVKTEEENKDELENDNDDDEDDDNDDDDDDDDDNDNDDEGAGGGGEEEDKKLEEFVNKIQEEKESDDDETAGTSHPVFENCAPVSPPPGGSPYFFEIFSSPSCSDKEEELNKDFEFVDTIDNDLSEPQFSESNKEQNSNTSSR